VSGPNPLPRDDAGAEKRTMTAGQAPMARYTRSSATRCGRGTPAARPGRGLGGRVRAPKPPGGVAGPRGRWRPHEEVARREGRGKCVPWLSLASGAAAGAARSRRGASPTFSGLAWVARRGPCRRPSPGSRRSAGSRREGSPRNDERLRRGIPEEERGSRGRAGRGRFGRPRPDPRGEAPTHQAGLAREHWFVWPT